MIDLTNLSDFELLELRGTVLIELEERGIAICVEDSDGGTRLVKDDVITDEFIP